MPYIKSGTTVPRPDLRELAWDYYLAQSRSKFIGQRVLPAFNTPQKSGEYPVIPLNQLLKPQETARAPRSGYNRGQWEFDMRNYTTSENGWEEPLDDVEASMYSYLLDAEEVSAMRCVDVILRNQERRVAALVMNAANVGDTQAVTGGAWNAPATAKPEDDINAAKDKMEAFGLQPNALILSAKTLRNLVRTDELRDRLQYTNAVETMSQQERINAVAAYFMLPAANILVGDSLTDSAKEGQATTSIGQIWSENYALLAKISSGGMDLREPSLGRTFVWGEEGGQLTVEQYRDDSVRSNIYRARQFTGEAITYKGAAVLITGIKA